MMEFDREAALEALKYRTASKPINLDFSIDGIGLKSGHCPTCNADVFNYEKYCSQCGQKLDWGKDK